jgi:large subunit ribosomal protein L14e
VIEIGRVCVKTAGRDARAKCLVVDILNKNYVLIDGQTRRRKCNIAHLEPLDKVAKIESNASHEEIVEALKEFGIEVVGRTAKAKTEKPRKARAAKGKKEPKKQEKKEKPKKTKKTEPKQ